MKLITSPVRLEAEFTRLIRKYDAFLWVTAWAGVASKPFQELLASQSKIRQVVVGLHFYRTHPDFIQAFVSHKYVRFIKQPQGTFHPKLYLFRDNDGRWELLVGSGNFTNAAFTMNTEASVLISDADDNAAAILKSALATINAGWNDAGVFTQSELDGYRKTWKTQRPKVQSLSGQYGGTQASPKPFYTVPVGTMTRAEFIDRVRHDPHHSMAGRLRVVEKARGWFQKYEHFNEMTEDERKFIAGLPNAIKTPQLDSGWFGSMKGNGSFFARIAANDANISRALDQIPLNGQLTKMHFEAFIREYRKTSSDRLVATATRLLAMKRPDRFVCFDSRNRAALCKEFAIPQTGMSYERYWDEIVERIADSEWYLNPAATSRDEERVGEARAAFLDSLYYREKKQ